MSPILLLLNCQALGFEFLRDFQVHPTVASAPWAPLGWCPPALTCTWGLTVSVLPAHTPLPPKAKDWLWLHSCPCHTDPTSRQPSKRPLVLAPGISPPRAKPIQRNPLSTVRWVTCRAGAVAAQGLWGGLKVWGDLWRVTTGTGPRPPSGGKRDQSAQPQLRKSDWPATLGPPGLAERPGEVHLCVETTDNLLLMKNWNMSVICVWSVF